MLCIPYTEWKPSTLSTCYVLQCYLCSALTCCRNELLIVCCDTLHASFGEDFSISISIFTLPRACSDTTESSRSVLRFAWTVRWRVECPFNALGSWWRRTRRNLNSVNQKHFESQVFWFLVSVHLSAKCTSNTDECFSSTQSGSTDSNARLHDVFSSSMEGA